MKDWYKDWFDTEYYHILYQNRDFEEARTFIKKLTSHLSILENSKILDLACGKGRHSIFLNQLGFNVTGIDLSEQSIKALEDLNSDSLRFIQSDMREVYKANHFDYVLNLFTSFGYFNEDEENEKVIHAIKDSLKPGGIGVIDYLNPKHSRKFLPKEEEIKKDDIQFQIKKFENAGMVHKQIRFTDQNEDYFFSEAVKFYELDDFKRFFKHNDLKLLNVFGSYRLEEFHEDYSTRLIMIFAKKP